MATATIIGSTQSSGVRDGQNLSARETTHYVNPDEYRKPEYAVYIHTISKRAFEQPNAIYRNVIIPACPKDKPYLTVMKINHPVNIPVANPDNPSEPKIVIENAKRLALSICNPNYIGGDLSLQDKEVPAEAQLSTSEANLTRQGVFASLNQVPTEEELKKAEERRHNYYKFRFEEANGLERSDPKRLQEVLGLDHHMAAEYFGVDVGWHRVVSAKIECPNCGDKIKEGIAFHYNNNRICVLDWEKAYIAGAVKKEDVPESKIWWNEGFAEVQLSDEPRRGPGRPKAS